MGFMEPQITKRVKWYEIETDNGSTYYVEADCAMKVEELADYAPEGCGKPVQATLIVGHGARLSAPGYMDCTDWTVFETAKGAASFLLETYYDSPDDEMTEDEREESAWLASID